MGKSKRAGKNPGKSEKIQGELLLEDPAPKSGNGIDPEDGAESGAGATLSTNEPPPTGTNSGEAIQGEDAGEALPAKPPLVLLVNDHKGCWKQLEGEERSKLSEEEWRAELTRHFKRSVPAPETQ